MLERAAGCLENAGRRFFRDPNGAAARRRGSSSSRFWQHGVIDFELPNWLLALLPASDQRGLQSSNASSVGRVSNHARIPFLDFLYPPEAHRYAASCFIRQPRRVVPRRRKRSFPCFKRSYTSDATSPSKTVENDSIEPAWSADRPPMVNPKRAKAILASLINEGKQKDYARAWDLYEAAGHPSDMKSALLSYLSNSEGLSDEKRVAYLFKDIPEESRSAEDYLHAAKSRLLALNDSSQAKRICQEALDKDAGLPCLAWIFAYALDTAQWTFALDMWNMRPRDAEDDQLLVYIEPTSVTKIAVGLATFVNGQRDNGLGISVARFLLNYIIGSLKVIEKSSTETILRLLRRYNEIGILTANDYYKLIETLQSSKVRSSFVRSIVVYRNFRWLMRREVPPTGLLTGLLSSLASFEISNGVQYLLDEFSHFHEKPPLDAYRNALVAFSRTGETESIDHVFNCLVADHGKPSNQKFLTPLLYVHARMGNVEKARKQFRRVKEEFGLEQNTVCWNILLTAHARNDDFAGTFSTFERMLNQGVEPDSHTFGTIMGLCANRGDVDSVRYLLGVASARQIRITAPVLDTVVEVYCNNGRLDLAESVAETCLNLDVQGSLVRMWNVLLWNYAFRIDLEAVSRIRSRMDAAGLQPDGMTYSALMLTLVLIGETDSARRILRTFHRSRRVYVTEFHYAIILYGYVKAKNRDMVHIILREVKERFGRLGPSSRLMAIWNELRRDLNYAKASRRHTGSSDVRLKKSEKLLAETIANFDVRALASKLPSPGFGKQSLSQAFPAIYYENIIKAYGTVGASKRAQELFDEYISGKQPLDPSVDPYDLAPLRLLCALMVSHLTSEQYIELEKCWKMAFPRAVKMASRPNIDQWLASPSETSESKELPSSTPDFNQENREPYEEAGSADATDSEDQTTILPSYRFMLSRPISLYMQSLAFRDEFWRLPHVVEEVENAGFALTTFNWSTYVQMLSQSGRPSDQLEAFAVFETKFMPNFPGWRRLRRGLGARPANVPDTIDFIEHPRRPTDPKVLGKAGRKYWTSIQPDFMQPNYTSMVYLASSLLAFRERSIIDGGRELNELYDRAPRTVDVLTELPYLRDKFQAVLLRQRQLLEDVQPTVKPHEPLVWTGGILGVEGQLRWRGVHAAEKQMHKVSDKPDAANITFDVSAEKQEAEDHDRDPEDVDVDAAPSKKTLSRQDEHDIETETLLERMRRPAGMQDAEWESDENTLKRLEDRLKKAPGESKQRKKRKDSWWHR